MALTHPVIIENLFDNDTEPNMTTSLQTEDGRVNCDDCGKQLSRLPDLKRHKLLHAENRDELKYKCSYPQCIFSTLQRSNFQIHLNTHMGIKPYTCDQLFPSLFYPNVMIPCKFRTAHPGNLRHHMLSKHGFAYPKYQRRFPTKSKCVQNITKGKCKAEEDPTGGNGLSPYISTGSLPDSLFPAFPFCSGSSGSGTTGLASLSSAISLDSERDYHASIFDGMEMSPWFNDFEVPPTFANSMLDTSLDLASGQEDALEFGSAFPSCPSASSSSLGYSFPGDDLFSDVFTTSTGSGFNNQMELTASQVVPFDVTFTGSQQEFGPLVSSQDMKYSIPYALPLDIPASGLRVEPDYFSLSAPQLPSSFPGVIGLDAAPLYTFPTQGNLGFSDLQSYESGSRYPSMNTNIQF